ncbi:LysM peptidoglycan-binding domain-containing protein [Demequina sp. SO4-18]|uniref:LysM peptidoglycan-binding domain-containing protein n=1 Tax=Demequina sp. SO4-18 TaxID=3401026 RepID=UPI003B5C92C4
MAPSISPARRARTAAFAAATALAATAFTALPAAADERHRVSDGDTVSALAVRYGTSVRSIIEANDLGSRALIIVGQQLTIPTAGAKSATAASGTHTVAAGDTVWDLARRYGTTVSALVAVNGLDARAVIREGQSLTVPGGGAASPVSATSAPTGTARHTVGAGDTVWDLARRFGTSVSSIVSANGLDSRAVIREGQTLTIPGATAVGDAPASASTTVATDTNLSEFGGTTQQHTVSPGDTLARIAERSGVSVSAIVSANAIKNPSMIRIGQKLTIPGGAPTGLVGDTFLGRTYSAGVVGAANQNKATLNAMDVPSRAQMQQMIVATARDMGVDPALAQAVAFQESGFNMRAVSPANAVGAMQVIPTTGEWASDLVGRELNLLDPQDNVTAGVAVLRHLQRDGRALETAIAGYYQGETGVRKYGMYADTKRYVASVLALMGRFS